MDLSIVIPVYEERDKIGRDIKAASEFLTNHHLAGEIIVVDDGSKDKTAETAKNIEVPADISVKVIHYEPHRGKGHAVCIGVEQTKGRYVMFADSGGCVPYEDSLRGLELLEKGVCDIAHGSRKTAGCHIEKAQSLYRRICSRIFRWFVIYYMKIPPELTDTQCGFKIYRGDIARELYGRCVTEGFAFDIEIIKRAQKEGYKIMEFPINWTCDRDSRLSPTRSSRYILSELMIIKKVTVEK